MDNFDERYDEFGEMEDNMEDFQEEMDGEYIDSFHEGEMNDFEKKVIYDVANLDSVVFWHRNLERGKGFLLNGFINHYPDFIVKMKNGKIILIETKGDHLDGSDSLQKLRLGAKWASKAGDNYRYFMVFDSAKLDGAKTVAELIEILKDMK